MGRMGQENCTGQYISACIEYLHCVGCPSNVVAWFLTMCELVEWMELFCTLGNEAMIIVDETKVVSEIGYFFWAVESPAQPEPIQEVVGSQQLRHGG